MEITFIVVAFLLGYIFHVAITKYLHAAEAKVGTEVKTAESDIKKL